MENNQKENFTFQTLDLLAYMFKNWKTLAIITFIGAVASAVVSLTITPKYRSTTIFFPTTTSSVSKALISNNVFLNKDVLMFGDEEDAEQMIQILYSDEIRSRLIEKYDLINHYGIDPNSKVKWTALDRKMKENISFTKTKYMSVQLSVMDEDPQTAKNMVEDISSFLDSTIHDMREEIAIKAYKIVEKEYLNAQNDIRKIEDSLKYISSQGLYDYEIQAKSLNEAYVSALSKGNDVVAGKIKKDLSVLAKYGATFKSLTKFLENENERLSLLKAKYMEAKVDAENQLPHKFVVTNPFVPEIKCYPKKTMIVTVSTISSFLFGLMIILLFDYIKKLRTKKII